MTETTDPITSLAPEAPILEGRFRIRRKLGVGGMGVVYEAFDERRGMEVALKTLRRLSPEGAMLLKREFRIAAQLRHPNLIRFFDLILTQNSCFFSMELVSGQSLLSFVQSRSEEAPSPTPPDNTGGFEDTRPHPEEAPEPPAQQAGCDLSRLLHALPQVCAALDVLHQAGVVHRDLKPGNILVSQEGVVKLLDFGIAQTSILSEEERARAVSGTPHYMSPEHARGKRVGPAADMYSLGVILYRLLTGRAPFSGKTGREILLAHIRTPPTPPSQLAPGIPPALEELCLALLQKKPSLRPGAREVAERLVQLGAPPASFGRLRPRRFVGRQAELETLEKQAEEVKAGKKRGIVLQGESGAGKSALCEEAARRLSEAGWRILSGRCYEREEIPYNALDPLIDAIASSLRERPGIQEALPPTIGFLARMFPSLLDIPGVSLEDGLGAQESRKRAKEALSTLLPLFAQEKPLLLWVDDLQWADADSLELLRSLFVSSSFPFLFLGTCRLQEGKAASLLQSFFSLPEMTLLRMEPFGAREVGALLGADASDSLVERIAKEAGGNAFLATELAQSFTEGESQAGQLSALLSTRLSLLSDEPRLVLRALSAAGSSVSFAALRQVVDLSPPALSQALDDLRADRWIREVDKAQGREEAYDIYHDRIREVVYGAVGEGERRRLHSRWGAVLEEGGGEPEAVAGHFLRAGLTEKAAHWFLMAARKAAQQLAPLRAAELYTRVLEVGGASFPFAQEAREERASVLDFAGGCYKEAAAAYCEAAAHTRGALAVRLLLRAAEADLRLGAVEDALSAVAQAMAPYERLRFPKTPLGSLAEAGFYTLHAEWKLRGLRALPGRNAAERDSLKHFLYQRVGGTLASFDVFRSVVFANRSISLALSRGSDEDVVDALALYSVYVAIRRGRKNLARAQELCERCYQWRHAAKEIDMVLWIETAGGIVATHAGRYQDACRILPAALSSYRAAGRLTGIEIVTASAHLALAESGAGKPQEGNKRLSLWLERAIAENDLFVLRSIAPTAVWVRLLCGDLPGARAAAATVREARSITSPTGMSLEPYLAALLLAEGGTTAARAILERILSEPIRSGTLFLIEKKLRAGLFLGATFLAEARRAPSRASRLAALRRARQAIAPAISSDDPVLEGIGFRLAGLIEEARGARKSALFWLDRAIRSLSEQGEAVELAAALLARGALTGDTEYTTRGKAILEEGGFLDPALREGGGWHW